MLALVAVLATSPKACFAGNACKPQAPVACFARAWACGRPHPMTRFVHILGCEHIVRQKLVSCSPTPAEAWAAAKRRPPKP